MTSPLRVVQALLVTWITVSIVSACSICCNEGSHSRAFFAARRPSLVFDEYIAAQTAEDQPSVSAFVGGNSVHHRYSYNQFLPLNSPKLYINSRVSAKEKGDEEDSDAPVPTSDEKEDGSVRDESDDDQLSGAMIASIGFYKQVISPLLPPACRFVPTCSQYGVQAIKEFGTTKGSILIAWRLLRCSPIGGKGYDPPKWPPVAYTYSSY